MSKNILARNIIIHNYIEQISNECSKQGIRFILLKGAALIELFPEYSFEREMEDIDVLVEEKFYNKFIDILQKLGFKQSQTDPNVMYFNDIKIDVTTKLWYLNKKENTKVIKSAIKLKDNIYVLSPLEMLRNILYHAYIEHNYLDSKWEKDIEILKKYYRLEFSFKFPKIVDFFLKLNIYHKGHIVKFLFLPWHKRLCHFFYYIFPSTEFMLKRYNVRFASFLPFFYLYRVLDLYIKFFNLFTNFLTSYFKSSLLKIT